MVVATLMVSWDSENVLYAYRVNVVRVRDAVEV